MILLHPPPLHPEPETNSIQPHTLRPQRELIGYPACEQVQFKRLLGVQFV